MPNVLKSGSLNLLEPSGPVQACNGIALHSPLSVLCCWPYAADETGEKCNCVTSETFRGRIEARPKVLFSTLLSQVKEKFIVQLCFILQGEYLNSST